MQDERHADDLQVEQRRTNFDRFTDYEDGDCVVICDRKNPSGWIRSDVTEPLEL